MLKILPKVDVFKIWHFSPVPYESKPPIPGVLGIPLSVPASLGTNKPFLSVYETLFLDPPSAGATSRWVLFICLCVCFNYFFGKNSINKINMILHYSVSSGTLQNVLHVHHVHSTTLRPGGLNIHSLSLRFIDPAGQVQSRSHPLVPPRSLSPFSIHEDTTVWPSVPETISSLVDIALWHRIVLPVFHSASRREPYGTWCIHGSLLPLWWKLVE